MRCSPIRLLQAAGLVGFAACLMFSSCFSVLTRAQANKRLEEVTKSEKAQESRLALVIGNGEYKGNLLKNPVNDARAMAALLQKQGFVVVEKENLTQAEMQDAIRAFGEKLEATSVAVARFYFSGHGLQAAGQNWLVPSRTAFTASGTCPTRRFPHNGRWPRWRRAAQHPDTGCLPRQSVHT